MAEAYLPTVSLADVVPQMPPAPGQTGYTQPNVPDMVLPEEQMVGTSQPVARLNLRQGERCRRMLATTLFLALVNWPIPLALLVLGYYFDEEDYVKRWTLDMMVEFSITI